MNKLNDTLKLLDLEIEKEYKAKSTEDSFATYQSGVYKIDCDGLIYYKLRKRAKWEPSCIGLSDLITGRTIFTDVPFKPNIGGYYWGVCPNGIVDRYICIENSLLCTYMINTGNCFKTKEDAEQNKHEIVYMLKGFKEMYNEVL